MIARSSVRAVHRSGLFDPERDHRREVAHSGGDLGFWPEGVSLPVGRIEPCTRRLPDRDVSAGSHCDFEPVWMVSGINRIRSTLFVKARWSRVVTCSACLVDPYRPPMGIVRTGIASPPPSRVCSATILSIVR